MTTEATKRASIVELSDGAVPVQRTVQMVDRRSSIMMRGRRGTLRPSKSNIWSMGVAKKSLSVPLQFENTYRTRPETDDRFRCGSVQETLGRVMRAELQNEVYDPSTVADLSRRLVDRIKRSIKDLDFQRFKLVCLVHIGSRQGASPTSGAEENSGGGGGRGVSLSVGSRCLWFPENGDNVVDNVFENDSLFVVAAVYGLYCE